jgi:hypothetical protein
LFFGGIFIVLAPLQLDLVQKYLIKSIFEADFEKISGFFPFRFAVKKLSFGDNVIIDDLKFTPDRSVFISTIVIKKDIASKKFNIKKYTPLIYQKIIKDIVIENFNNVGTIHYKSGDNILFESDIGNIMYFIKTGKLKLNMEGKLTVSGVVDFNDQKFYGNVYTYYMDQNISTCIYIDDRGALSGKFHNKFIDAKLKYDTKNLLVEKCRIKNIVKFKPFEINSEEIDKIEIDVGEGKVFVDKINFGTNDLGKWKFENIELSKIFQDISGRLNGSGYFNTQNQTANFDLYLNNGKFNKIELPKINLKAIYQKHLLNIKMLYNLLKKKNIVNANIYANNWIINNNSRIDVKAKGIFDISHSQLNCKIKYDINLGGTIISPLYSGIIQVSDGKYINSKYGVYLKDIKCSTFLKNGKLVIEKIYATDDMKKGGVVTGSGSIYLKNNTPYMNINLDIKSLDFLEIRSLDAKISGKLEVKGEINKEVKITGDLITDSLKLDISNIVKMANYGMDIVNSSKKNSINKKRLKNTFISMPIDVKVKIVPMHITGYGVNSIWTGEVGIFGNGSTGINYKGTIVLEKGTINIVGKNFNLGDGIIGITGDGNNDSKISIDVSASRSMENMKIGARFIQNNMGNEIKYFSEPYISEKEILSYMLFEKPSSEISTNEMFTILSITNNSSGDIMDKLKRILFVDVVEIKKRHNDISGEDDNYIKVGKKIGKFRFSIDRGTLNDTTGVTIDTNLSKNTKISVSKNTDLNGGIFWSKRY